MKDLTDIDYKDLFRDAVNMMAHIARAAGFDPNDPTVEPPAIVARVENLRAEVERLTALVERQRLTLLAEQGIAEGAPSDRWTWGIIDEEGGIGWKRRTARGMIFAWGRGVELGSRGQPSEPHPGGWAEWTTNEDGDLDDEIARATDALWNALDAMEAAEAAHPSTPEPSAT